MLALAFTTFVTLDKLLKPWVLSVNSVKKNNLQELMGRKMIKRAQHMTVV